MQTVLSGRFSYGMDSSEKHSISVTPNDQTCRTDRGEHSDKHSDKHMAH